MTWKFVPLNIMLLTYCLWTQTCSAIVLLTYQWLIYIFLPLWPKACTCSTDEWLGWDRTAYGFLYIYIHIFFFAVSLAFLGTHMWPLFIPTPSFLLKLAGPFKVDRGPLIPYLFRFWVCYLLKPFDKHACCQSSGSFYSHMR